MLLGHLLRRQGVEVMIFATGMNWDAQSVAQLKAAGVKFILPPASLRRSHRLSVIYSSLAWLFQVPSRANSLYCIGPGLSHLWLQRLKPKNTPSINHEIVEPPGPQSLAGQCATGLDVTVANSKKVAQVMSEIWREKPMRIIPFLTADAPTTPPVLRRRAGVNEVLRVVYLGRLVEHKRPDQLVFRWQALTAHPALASARLDVYGFDPTGTMLKELRTFVVENHLSNNVTIHGEYALNALPEILANSELVVLPSLAEGLPLVLVEAMLHGVPFVATAAGGTAELGEDNPDVLVTGTDWAEFEAGLLAMAVKIRAGGIDPVRLHAWAEARYGHAAVSQQWLDCLLNPRSFFGLHD